jgi:hypothetical protein
MRDERQFPFNREGHMTEKKKSTALQTGSGAKVPTMGRPSVYSCKVADVILDRLAAGDLLSAICLQPGMPKENTVRGWVIDNRDSFAERYGRAVQMGLDRHGEGLLSIADDSSGDMTLDKDGRAVVNHEHIRRSEVRIRTRQWLLEASAPADLRAEDRAADHRHVGGRAEEAGPVEPVP